MIKYITILLLVIISSIGIFSVKSEILVTENNHFDNEINTKKSVKCYPSPENRIMQSFYVDFHQKITWLTYDNNKRDHQLIEKYDNKKNIIEKQEYYKKFSIGHLDGIYVESDAIFTTDKWTNPSIIKIKNKNLIGRLQYPIEIIGNQVLAVDRQNTEKFIVWATEKESGNKKIFTGKFDSKKEKILRFKKSKIISPKDEVLQGIALDNNKVYVLTGLSPPNSFLYIWNMENGILIKRIPLESKIKKYKDIYKYEPEGLNIISDDNGEKIILIGIAVITKTKKHFNCIIPFSS
ncbi:phage baseplate protein [Yersinia frederiksenii]|uniref:phage baseplate protein n=1 Tax=Yersinia frederiksenii TaxID=29484 RepID=UPI0005DAEE27|nr:hypothetical protein [Yersinia frederiksenii]CNL87927.1 Uncharacterised protein [Yersinia frederiksenii]